MCEEKQRYFDLSDPFPDRIFSPGALFSACSSQLPRQLPPIGLCQIKYYSKQLAEVHSGLHLLLISSSSYSSGKLQTLLQVSRIAAMLALRQASKLRSLGFPSSIPAMSEVSTRSCSFSSMLDFQRESQPSPPQFTQFYSRPTSQIPIAGSPDRCAQHVFH